MRYKLITVLLISVFSLPLCSDYAKCRLIRVVDGDTFIVQYYGKSERVRLTGIDTPEDANNAKAKKDAKWKNLALAELVKQGKRSTSFAKTLLAGEKYVFIEFDAQERDHYGRILAYIYLSDGRMVNDLMLKAGYAVLMTVPPNVKYKDRFLKSYREARAMKRGLWAR